MVRPHLGRHVYGLAAVLFGVVALVWHDFNIWQQIRALGAVEHRGMLVYIYAAVELLGGIAIQWRRTARDGAAILGVVSLVFALLWAPSIAASPQVYDFWGNFFEQFSLVSGALIVYATVGETATKRSAMLARIGYICFGLCVISFTLEQLFYLSGTASFVPKWIPPSQMFWAVTTTIAFGLAALALFSGFWNLLASRLLTAMIIGFGLFIWLPAPFVDPHKQINWAGNAENLAIAGAAWIVADYLGQSRAAARSVVAEGAAGSESFGMKPIRG
ncbi:MAG TPA: hypothetical protein VKB49_17885 [Candidatus Sulfotelmatobacter sp.]|nr:hypothetical protein [Candidatus Sulfotelmatobacter sp.]